MPSKYTRSTSRWRTMRSTGSTLRRGVRDSSNCSAWYEESIEREPEHGACGDQCDERAVQAAQVGPCRQRVAERQHKRDEACVVQASPASLPDPAPGAERGCERKAEPGGDHPGRNCAYSPGRCEGNEQRRKTEVECRVEEQRRPVQRDHRQSRPGECPVQSEQRLLTTGAEQPGAHREAEPDGQGKECERDEACRTRDVP